MTWLEKITAEEIIVSWESIVSTNEFESFFPFKRQIGLKFEFVKGKDNKNVALVSTGFNTNVLYRDRIGFEELQGSMPFFKEAYSIDEETRQALLQASTNEAYLNILLDKVFDDTDNLLQSAEITAERMRAQLISQGTIAIIENGVNKNYDYGFDSSTQFKDLSSGNYWGTEKVKPLETIETAIETYRDNHEQKDPEYLVMSRKLFNKYIRKDEEVVKHFASLQVPNPYPTKAEVLSYVESLFDIKILLSENTYRKARDFNGKPVAMYPTDRFTLIGAETLGNTIYGTTPEEADLMAGASKAEVAITTKGVSVTTWVNEDPVNKSVKVAEVCLPTCPQLDKLYIVKVLASAE